MRIWVREKEAGFSKWFNKWVTGYMRMIYIEDQLSHHLSFHLFSKKKDAKGCENVYEWLRTLINFLKDISIRNWIFPNIRFIIFFSISHWEIFWTGKILNFRNILNKISKFLNNCSNFEKMSNVWNNFQFLQNFSLLSFAVFEKKNVHYNFSNSRAKAIYQFLWKIIYFWENSQPL